MAQIGTADSVDCGLTHQRESHQIYSFLCADNYMTMSHSKVHLEQRMRELIEEAERRDLESKPAESVVEHQCRRGGGRRDESRQYKGLNKFPFWKTSKFL